MTNQVYRTVLAATFVTIRIEPMLGRLFNLVNVEGMSPVYIMSVCEDGFCKYDYYSFLVIYFVDSVSSNIK